MSRVFSFERDNYFAVIGTMLVQNTSCAPGIRPRHKLPSAMLLCGWISAVTHCPQVVLAANRICSCALDGRIRGTMCFVCNDAEKK